MVALVDPGRLAPLTARPAPVAEALAADQATIEIRVKRISAALASAGIDSRPVPADAAVVGGGPGPRPAARWSGTTASARQAAAG
jgi:hypothetical protein